MSNWLDITWKYRRPITIDNTNNSNTLTDYQIKLSLNSSNFDFSKANSDGSDIRFTDSDGVTKLSYWIENWDSTNQTATVWIKVNSIPASSTKDIYIYYGNPSATSESNGDNTFVFFDDFNSSSLDSNKWDDYTSGYTISDSEITYHSQDESWKYLRSKQTFSPPIRLVYHIAYQGDWGGTGTKYDGFKGNALGGSHLDYSLSDDNGPFVGFGEGIVDWNETPAVGNGIDSTKVDGGNASGGNNIYTTHDADIKWDTSNATLDKIWNNTHYNNTFTTNIPTDPEPIIFGVKGRNDYERRIYVDYVIVANYTSPAPSQTVGNEELSPRIQRNASLYNLLLSKSVESQFAITPSKLINSDYDVYITQIDNSKYDYFLTNNLLSSYKVRDSKVTQLHQSTYYVAAARTLLSSYDICLHRQQNANYFILSSNHNIGRYNIYTTLTQASNASYNILLRSYIESTYKIKVASADSSPYTICVHKDNLSKYTTKIASYNKASYPIEISKEVNSSYSTLVHRRIASEYKIIKIFHPKVIHTAKYRITDYTWISIPNQSRYGINWSGLTSIVERIACIATPYANYTSDRYIAPKLFLSYDTDRNLLTNSYRIVPDERQTFVERQKLQSERYTTYERFYTEQDKVSCLWSGYFVESDTRNNTLTSYAQAYTNRYTICTERETLQTDRHCFTICIWNSYRHIHTKYWWPSERYAISGYCIPFKTFADQRICHPQIHTTKLAVIRSAYTESCSFTYQLTINPKYQSFSCGETESSYRELFSSTVTPIISNFYNIPVNWFYSEHDLIIIKDDGNWWANIGEDPAPFVPLERLTAHTLAFKGYLIHRHKPLYVRLTFMFEKQPGFESPDAYYKYLIRHGYLKVTVNTKEVEDRDAVIACDKPMFPIPFEVQMYEKLVRKVTLKIVYGYPYFDMRKNKSLLYFRYTPT